jgi:hypothetical protein
MTLTEAIKDKAIETFSDRPRVQAVESFIVTAYRQLGADAPAFILKQLGVTPHDDLNEIVTAACGMALLSAGSPLHDICPHLINQHNCR